jgi:prolyl oligopeptidase
MPINRRRFAMWPAAFAAASVWPLGAEPADAHRWLEMVDSPEALTWVNARNAEALALIEREPDFLRRRRDTLAALSSGTNIQFVSRSGNYLYNFYRTGTRPHGVWRRTTLAEYAKPRPDWQVLLDVDELARSESRNLVFASASAHAASERALVLFSVGGEDKVELREFDLASRSFVTDGFRAGPAKLTAVWFNADELLIASDFGAGSLTASGYPLSIRRWRRGSAIEVAPTLLSGDAADMMVSPSASQREGLPVAVLLQRRIRFYEMQRHLLHADGAMSLLDLPPDASVWLDREWLMVALRGGWTVDGRSFAPGSLLTLPLAEAMQKNREFHVLLKGAPRRRLVRAESVKDGFVVASTDNMTPELYFFKWDGKGFESNALPAPIAGLVSIGADDAALNNRYWLTSQAPLVPQQLALVDAAAPALAPAVRKNQAAAFDASSLVVEQFEARSKDGTLIPYTVTRTVRSPAAPTPTLLYGYGGFGLPLELDYQRMPGLNWLRYGGTYVLAHIRGGGEFGPDWYQAAKGSRRQTAFDDFIAVAEDLVARGLSTPAQLGIYGASNGGALMAAVMVQRPELFGAVVSRVPLTDMLGFAKLFAGASWTEEYGDPAIPAEQAVLARWSPYHNARKAADGVTYPPALFIGNRNDDRVHPSHARKMVARLRELGHQKVWLYEEMSGGHSGRTDPQIFAQREALIYSFLKQQLTVVPA